MGRRLMSYAEKREADASELERLRQAIVARLTKEWLGKRMVARSIDGAYFLGDGVCTAILSHCRVVLLSDSGARLDVAMRCCELVAAA